jgi:peptidoglycan hydrolase-like protein with peptidoglycan-binding domain
MNKKLPENPIHFVTLRNWLYQGSAAGLFVVCLGFATSAIGQEMDAANLLPLVDQGAVEVTENGVQNAALPAASASERVDRPTLKPGSQGDSVSELQAALKLLGYHVGSVDGLYGNETANAVSRFQAAAGLETDGVVGPATWDRLFPAPPKAGASPTKSNVGSTAMPPASIGVSELPPADPTGTAFPIPATASPGAPAPPVSYPAPTAAPVPQSPTPAPNANPSQPTVRSTRAATPTNEVMLPTLRRGMRGSAVTHLQERLKSLGWLNGAIDGVFGQETELAVKAAQRRHKIDPDGVVGALTWSALFQ